MKTNTKTRTNKTAPKYSNENKCSKTYVLQIRELLSCFRKRREKQSGLGEEQNKIPKCTNTGSAKKKKREKKKLDEKTSGRELELVF